MYDWQRGPEAGRGCGGWKIVKGKVSKVAIVDSLNLLSVHFILQKSDVHYILMGFEVSHETETNSFLQFLAAVLESVTWFVHMSHLQFLSQPGSFLGVEWSLLLRRWV